MAPQFFLGYLGSQESKKTGGIGPERRPLTPIFWTLADGLYASSIQLIHVHIHIIRQFVNLLYADELTDSYSDLYFSLIAETLTGHSFIKSYDLGR